MTRGIMALEELDDGLNLPPEDQILETSSPTDSPKEDTPPVEDTNPGNKPIDISDLNVVELEENEAIAKTELLQEEHRRQEAISEVSDNADLLHHATESLVNCLNGKGTSSEFKLATGVYDRLRGNLGLHTQKRSVSLEDYSNPDTKAIAVESFMDTMKTVISAVINAIIKAIEWLKKVFRDYFNGNKRLIEANRQMHSMLLKIRTEHKDKLEKIHSEQLTDQKRYVDLPIYKPDLTYEGKQPGEMLVKRHDNRGNVVSYSPSYPEAIADITGLFSLHAQFQKRMTSDLSNGFEQIFNAISKGDDLESVNIFDPKEFIPDGAELVSHAEGIDPEEDCLLYIKTGYLGNFSLVQQILSSSTAENATDPITRKLLELGNWRGKYVSTNTSMSDGWLRNLSTEEIKLSYEACNDLSHQVVAMEKTVESVEHTLTTLKGILNKIKGDIRVDMDYSTDAGIKQNQAYIQFAKSIGAVVNTTNAVLTGSADRARKFQFAWLYYLNAIKIKEIDLLQKQT